MYNHIIKLVNKNRKKIKYLLFILSIIYLLIYIHPTSIQFDENYTLSLIKNNYIQILRLDSLDVHPPLYYLLLKGFLQITTFWTSYFPIKIIAARLFTILSSVISLIFLYKINNILKIKNNIIPSWLLFIILPTVLGFSFSYQQMTNIRMYALTGLFIIIEFFYLLKYRIHSNNIYLIMAIITASLASYTHYYSAIFAGLLLLFYFIKYLFDHNTYKSISLMISGILFALLYIPWIGSLINQMKMPETYWISYFFMTKQIILCILCIALFIYPIIKYCKLYDNKLFKEEVFLIVIILISTILFSLMYGILNHPIFIIRYMYPMLLIYEFIGINTVYKLIRNKNFSALQLMYYILIFALLIFNACYSAVYQISNYIIPSINAVNNYNKWNYSTKKNIYISDKDLYSKYNNSDFNFASLSYSKNKKRFSVPKQFIKNDYIQNNVAFRQVFNEDFKYVKIYNNK